MSGELVIIESPYTGNIEKNITYARKCIKDSLLRDECPFASHLLYTQEGILDDLKPDERTLGINAGLMWGRKADLIAIYEDLGISHGMKFGIKQAQEFNIKIEYRKIL